MLFEKFALGSLVGALTMVVAACSNDSAGDENKSRSELACEHLNDICAKTQGYQTRDCAATKAEYEKLASTEKAQADTAIACMMAAKSCEPAINCLRPPGSEKSSTPSGDTSSAKSNAPQIACEHINDVCSNEPSFKTQDCSHSNADYQQLTADQKQLADQIAPCIMEAQSCQAAFQCLKLN